MLLNLAFKSPLRYSSEATAVQLQRWLFINQREQELNQEQKADSSTYVPVRSQCCAGSRTPQVKGRNRRTMVGVGALSAAPGLGAFYSVFSRTGMALTAEVLAG